MKNHRNEGQRSQRFATIDHYDSERQRFEQEGAGSQIFEIMKVPKVVPASEDVAGSSYEVDTYE